MIPNTLHHVWLGNVKIPEIFNVFQRGWRKLHPLWNYKLWTDTDVTYFEQPYKDMIYQTNGYSSKSNIVRLYIMYKYGGVYCDMDFEFNRCIDELLYTNAFVGKETHNSFGNAIFGAEKKCEWVQYQLKKLTEYIGLKPPPWGPVLITEASKKFEGFITVHSSDYFYPYLWNDGPFLAKDFPNSYAVHHWSKLWTEENRVAEIEKTRTNGN